MSRRRWPRQTNNEERRKNAHRTIATTKNHTIKAQTGENHLNKIFVEQENWICPSRLLFKRVINSEKNSPTVLVLSFFFPSFFFFFGIFPPPGRNADKLAPGGIWIFPRTNAGENKPQSHTLQHPPKERKKGWPSGKENFFATPLSYLYAFPLTSLTSEMSCDKKRRSSISHQFLICHHFHTN